MKLYGHPRSSSTRKVLLTLAEKGATAEFVRSEPAEVAHRQPGHLEEAALDDDGFVLFESLAIMHYLDGLLPEPALVPRGLRERARLAEWLSAELSYFAPALARLDSQLRLGPAYGVAPDLVEVGEARREVARALDVLDGALAERPYLVDSGFSLAEIAYVPGLQLLTELSQGDLLAGRRHLAAWWERMRSRASFRAVETLPEGGPEAARLARQAVVRTPPGWSDALRSQREPGACSSGAVA